MKTLASILIITTVGLVGGSCASVVRVHEQSSTQEDKLKGIPFRLKTQICHQTTTYSQTWLTVGVSTETKVLVGKDEKTKVVTLSQQPKQTRRVPKTALDEVRGLQTLVLRANTCDQPSAGCPTLKQVIDAFAALPPLAEPMPAPQVPVGNFVEPRSVVDYQRELYLNGKLPWFGSATLTSKLNSDGTLTESTATSDTKLAEGLSALLPLKEFLSGEFVDTVAAPADDAVARIMEETSADTVDERTTVTVSVEEEGYLYVFEADHADPDGLCSEVATGVQSLTPIRFHLTTGAYRRSALGAAATSAAAKKDAIEFSGSVTMPKAAATPSGS